MNSSFLIKLFIFVIWIILLYAGNKYVKVKDKYSVWNNWWKEHNPNEEYKCVDMITVGLYNESALLYYIASVFSPLSLKLDRGAISMLEYLLKNGAVGIASRTGPITPKSLCKTIVPDKNILHHMNAWPTDEDGWRELLLKWANLEPGQPYDKADAEAWEDEEDNFLFRSYKMDVRSPIVQAFITKAPISGTGVTLNPIEFSILVGTVDANKTGGWIGWMLSLQSSNANFAEYARRVWSVDDPDAFIDRSSPANECQKPSPMQTAINAVSIGAGVGGMAGMFKSPPAQAASVGVGLILAGLSVANDLTAC